MLCTRCQGQNSDNVNFCVHCGAPLRSTCANCGTVNAAGARFCTNCGRAIGAASPPPAAAVPPVASPQPVVIVKQGAPGWLWALIGILIGVIVLGGLGLGGILPLNFLQKATSTPLPTLPPVIASTKTPEVLASVEPYCPPKGGVILYWNAGYDCKSESGDPGYRYRVGDGAQDLNTGEFDNQASALYVPAGWSVRLYENAGQKGASVCLNSSIPNFEERGNFPDKTIPVNDNISSMEIFADGTCGEDLAAGAEPALWPKNEPRINPPDEGNETQDFVCETDIRCGCMPAVLGEVDSDPGDGVYDWQLDQEAFQERFIESVVKDDENFTVKFKPEAGKLYDWLSRPGMDFDIVMDNFPIIKHEKCFFEKQADGTFSCKVKIPENVKNMDGWGIYVSSRTATGGEQCSKVLFGDTWNENFNFNQPQPTLQCTNANRPQVCGDQCCKKDDQCLQKDSEWICRRPDEPAQPVACSSGLGQSACSAAGGSWIDPPGSCFCP